MKEITRILQRIEQGKVQGTKELFPLVYDELRRIAGAKMNLERAGHTLSATALVHEAYVRLVDTDTVRQWDSRGHFFTAAAEAMRRILIENARRKQSQKRGGDRVRIELNDEQLGSLDLANPELLLDLDVAVTQLEEADPQAAELLKLLLFAGLSVAEAGRMMGLSRHSAYRNWDFIQAWFAAFFASAAE